MPPRALSVAARPRFVSRGGDKLDHAMTQLGVSVDGEDVCDLGSSTGGFVDRLLQGGAARVVAVDVGYGQLDWRPARGRARHRDGAHQRAPPDGRTSPVRSRHLSPPTSRSSP